ncbi:hypothetical protein Rcae01_01964 [Novipirellula caenicola]|uniref:Uncharacterized protein n=1 Tax=Novipirellula caenicola TaxID=1536901 RepID=A0ABP9VPC3_9BACT
MRVLQSGLLNSDNLIAVRCGASRTVALASLPPLSAKLGEVERAL